MLRALLAGAVQTRRPSSDLERRQNYYTLRTAPGLRFGAVLVYITGDRPAFGHFTLKIMIQARLKALSVEEVANSLTHGFGLLLSIAGFVFLLALAVTKGDGWHIASAVVYGLSLVILYAASTLYHSATDEHKKYRLQLIDHCCIYLLIAGSYTPFLLLLMRDTFGFGLLAFVWAFALFGIAIKIIFRGRYNAVGVVSYLAMGWVGIIAIQPLYVMLGWEPLALVLGGGLSYSLGVVFFGWHSLRHHHAIWHGFVLGGSILHYLAIVLFVVR